MAALIHVLRSVPPELGTCRAPNCGKAIEWVRTAKTGARMPVDAPLLVERVHEQIDGTPLTVIDAGRSHFATCPAAKQFRRAR